MMNVFATAALALALAAQAQSGPAREGIVVRGSWTIDVRDPDGRLVTHRQFENALTVHGQRILAVQLTRPFDGTPIWGIELASPAPLTSPCGGSCQTWQPAREGTVSPSFPQNVVVTPMSDTVVLTGSVRATADGDIGTVAARFMSCSPTNCTSSWRFSEKTIAPISVVTGQTIDLKVVVGFTSPSPPSTPQ